MLFGTRLAHGACTPSPLAGEGRDGGVSIEATPVCTPTRTLLRRGGGGLVSPLHEIGAEHYRGRVQVEGEGTHYTANRCRIYRQPNSSRWTNKSMVMSYAYQAEIGRTSCLMISVGNRRSRGWSFVVWFGWRVGYATWRLGNRWVNMIMPGKALKRRGPGQPGPRME
jgi:hypothetical protein